MTNQKKKFYLINGIKNESFDVSNVIGRKDSAIISIIQDVNIRIEQHVAIKILANLPQKISKKINKSAVSWLQAQCVLKNIQMETNVLAVILFYCIIRVRKIQKQQLQPILITCFYLANKFNNGPISSISQALDLVHKRYPVQQIITLQSELLHLLDFNLIIPNNFKQIQMKLQNEIDLQLYNKICFYIEILLLIDHTILFEKSKIDKIIEMEKQDNTNLSIYEQICEVLKLSQVQLILNKYRGKFSVDQLLTKFHK